MADSPELNFEQKLENYAELLVGHGLNVQEGQLVNISAEGYHRDFVLKITEAAYKRGAVYVDVDLTDPRTGRTRVLHSKPENLEFVPPYLQKRFHDIVDTNAANLKLVGSESPDLFADLDPQALNTLRKASYHALKYFYDEGIGKAKVHWTVAAAATQGWGVKVFPDDSPEEAEAKLWEEIFRICRADRPDCLDYWKTHNEALHARARKLTDLELKSLHFTGNSTDLRVGLSPKAVFKGGSDESPRGVPFEPNIPTEEVFTTPDWRQTEGFVKTTRPFYITGRLVEDLEITFAKGEIQDFKCSAGAETFEAYINSDPGGKRLGEVALVGIDSPVYQSGRVFQEILFDENAACHIAIGSAYKFCLDGGETMEAQELESLGCNESSVHTDMMISSEKVDVTAETFAGQSIPLIEKGRWVFA